MPTVLSPDFTHAATRALDALDAQLPMELWLLSDAQSGGFAARSNATQAAPPPLSALRSCLGATHIPQHPQVIGPIDPHLLTLPSRDPVVTLLYAPVRTPSGDEVGALWGLGGAEPQRAAAHALAVMEPIADVVGALWHAEQAVHRARRSAEEASQLALTDPLTGLFNRRGWDGMLHREERRCQRHGFPAVVVALDLDGLKSINDAHGHAAGDALLRRTARALQCATRSTDVVARLGGDEFAILAVQCDLDGARKLKARIQTELDAVGIRASLGVASRLPSGGLHAALATADQAMYMRKQAARC